MSPAAAPAGWERIAGGQLLGVWRTDLPGDYGTLYADPARGEVEFGQDICYRLTPAEARAYAQRLVEAAAMAEGTQAGPDPVSGDAW